MKNLKARALFFLVGLVVLSFGISMTIKADLGAGAWDALNVGLADITSLTVGNWVIIVGLILMIVNAWIVHTKPDYFAIITVLMIGFLIDFWLLIVMDSWQVTGFFMQFILLIFGIIILGLGVSVYLQPAFSLNPVDGLMVSLQKRFRLSTRVAKTLTEALACLLAFGIGGPIGVGTFVILIGVGPSIQLFEPIAKRLASRLDQKEAA